jgi:flagellar assembly factor FliW
VVKKMNIETKYLGQVEIDETKIIDFESGIPSFLDEKKFILLPFDETTPFCLLQSLTTPQLAFVVVSPFQFFPDYQAKLSDSTIEALQIETETDVALFLILTVEEPFTLTTANLQGPVAINSTKQKGKQIALNDPSYQTKHLLMPQTVTKEG